LYVCQNCLLPKGEQETILKEAEETRKKASERVKTLENKLKNAKAEREKELKHAEEELNKAKKGSDEATKTLKQKQQVANYSISYILFTCETV